MLKSIVHNKYFCAESGRRFSGTCNTVRIHNYFGLRTAFGKNCRLIPAVLGCSIAASEYRTADSLLLEEFTQPHYKRSLASPADRYVADAYDFCAGTMSLQKSCGV